jgi:hypothetical protein
MLDDMALALSAHIADGILHDPMAVHTVLATA